METNPDPQRLVPAVCRVLCSNVRVMARNLRDLTVASSQYDILLCSDTLISDMRHVSELLVPGCRGKMPRARGTAVYVRNDYGAFRQPKFDCGCCEMLVFRVYGVRQNLYVFRIYGSPNLDDRILDCLQASMAAVQAEDIRASVLFVGDCNGHHQEWLGSTITNGYRVAAFDFGTQLIAVSWLRSVGCRQKECARWNT